MVVTTDSITILPFAFAHGCSRMLRPYDTTERHEAAMVMGAYSGV